jgi:hypothetical protein
VDTYCIVGIVRVSAGEKDGNGETPILTFAQYEAVPFDKPVESQAEGPELIAFVRVGAGDIYDRLGVMPVEYFGDRSAKVPQVNVVAGRIREADVQVAFLFDRVKIFLMYGKGEYVGVVGENERRTVALMEVAVNDGESPSEPLVLRYSDRECYIVYIAETFGVVGERVVETSAVVHSGTAVFNGGPDRGYAASGGRKEAADYFGRYRHLGSKCTGRVASGIEVVQVFRRMDQLELFAGRRFRFQNGPQTTLGFQYGVYHFIFLYGKYMSLKVAVVIVGINEGYV